MDSCTFLEKGATHFLQEKVQVAPKTIKIYIKKVELILKITCSMHFVILKNMQFTS
jgi:hypothetical protein